MKARGFTLIELLAAMAILAVVSVMAVQALSGVVHQRSVLSGIDDRAAPLIRTLSLLRQDLEALVPPPAGNQNAETADTLTAGLVAEPGGFALWRGGIADLPGAAGGGLARVTWSVSGGDLRRGSVTMLEGVTALTVTPLGLPEAGETEDEEDEVDPATLAPGYEVTLETARWGALRVVVAR